MAEVHLADKVEMDRPQAGTEVPQPPEDQIMLQVHLVPEDLLLLAVVEAVAGMVELLE